MNRALCALIALLAVVAADQVSLRSTGNGWNYDRCDAVRGPSKWPLLCQNTAEQSPINLCGAELFAADKNTALDFSYASSVAMEVKSDGQAYLSQKGTETMTLNAHDIPRIVGRQTTTTDITWKFAQAHFHWGRDGHIDEGSEHYIEGVQHPLEIHLVHHNSKHADLTAALASGESDALLVVGQFFTIKETVANAPAAFQSVSAALFSGAASVTVKPDELIDQTGGFYSYAGSLTTPTCNPVVTWVVMAKAIGIPRSALDSFHDKTTVNPDSKRIGSFGDFRPLQPRAGRTVYMTTGVTTLICAAEAGIREPYFACSECESNFQTRSTSTSLEVAAIRRDLEASKPVSLASIFESRRSASGNMYDRCDATHGPAGWASSVTDAQCNAGEQSPIDLCGGIPLPEDKVTALKFDYPAEEVSMKLKTEAQARLEANGGESMTLNAHDIPRIVGRQSATETTDITWKFAQAHFHWGRDGHADEGSEHYIEGVQHPLEIHFVHVNSKYADLTAALASGNTDALLVVGQMFTVEDAMSAHSTETHAVGGSAVAGRRSGGSGWNWDRCDAAQGPAHWPSNDGAFCNAEEQSPIDLCGAEPFPAGMKTSLGFTYPATAVAMELKSDGQAYLSQKGTETMTLNAHDIPRIVGRQMGGDDITWKFAQAHFHWGREGHMYEGSEHYIEGVQHPLEIHLVHHNSKYADLTAALASGSKDAVLVVGQFFKVGDSMSAAMTAITGAFASASTTANRHNINVKPMELIDQTGGFYTYKGSLTTPTCNPVVTWVVMSKVMTITEAGLNSFHDKTVTAAGDLVHHGNFRPLQDRAGRTVYMSSGVTSLPCNPYEAREPAWSCGCDTAAVAVAAAASDQTPIVFDFILTGVSFPVPAVVETAVQQAMGETLGVDASRVWLEFAAVNRRRLLDVTAKATVLVRKAEAHAKKETALADRFALDVTASANERLPAEQRIVVANVAEPAALVAENKDDDDKCDSTCVGLAVGLGVVGALLLGALAYIALKPKPAPPPPQPSIYSHPEHPMVVVEPTQAWEADKKQPPASLYSAALPVAPPIFPSQGIHDAAGPIAPRLIQAAAVFQQPEQGTYRGYPGLFAESRPEGSVAMPGQFSQAPHSSYIYPGAMQSGFA